MREAIGPFDGQDPAVKFFESEFVGRSLLKAIQIDVIEREAPASVFMHEGERRTADFFGVDSQSRRQSSNECRLPCPQIPGQQKDIARREGCGEIAGNAGGLRF